MDLKFYKIGYRDFSAAVVIDKGFVSFPKKVVDNIVF